jgi:predicted PurR-regulated permease PerM
MPPYEWQRAIVVLAYVMIGVVVVAAMYWAQAVFVPLALAMLLTLVLTPLVQWLQRWHLQRAPAVVLVVALTSATVAGLGWTVTRQFVQLAGELPRYSETIKGKIRSLRDLATTPGTGRLGKMIGEISRELQRPAGKRPSEPPLPASAEPPLEGVATNQPSADARPQAVVLEPQSPAWLGHLTTAISSLGESLASFALAVVLTIFMLIHRERLRDRLIHLIGHGRLTATTKAFDEAVQRISRFLLMQLVVNGTYGLALAAGLLVLGVEFALLWGLLAAVLRYIPYVGAWIAAIPPVLVSFVMSEGWTQPMMVVAWIVIIELVSNNIVEPLLYGHSMGVSEVALLVAAAFWAFLWGPIGLVLSSPLTVCLVILGKYVPPLKFIDILLGDQPGLKPHESFYQRLLARDQDEARQIALAQLQAGPPELVFDRLVGPALSYFKRDLEHDLLTEQDRQFVLKASREIVDELGERLHPASEDTAEEAVEVRRVSPRVRILACPADGGADEVAIEMLRQLLSPARWDVQAAGDDVLAGELLESVSSRHVPLVCIGSLRPGGLAHSRYFCKRLRSHWSDVKIVVGRWGTSPESDAVVEQLRAAGADQVEWTLADTAKHLEAWWLVLTERSEPLANEGGPPRPHIASAAGA